MPVVLVTGAARRLGREIALEMGRAGWDVAVHYNHSQADAEEVVRELLGMGVQACAISANLSDELSCRTLLPKVIAAFGSVQAVVHNASMFLDDSAHTFSYDMLMAHMKTNTAPAIVLAQALYAHLQEQQIQPPTQHQKQHPTAPQGWEPGVVVNMLDQKLWNINPDHLSYTLSKAALLTATDMLARQLAPFVRVVGVAPGLTLPSTTMTQEEFEKLHQLSPLGKSSTAQDIAQTVCFAIKNRAMTGTSLLVDGGQHLMGLNSDFSKI